MYTHFDKSKEKKCHVLHQENKNAKGIASFVDNRPETLVLKKLSTIANSHSSTQLARIKIKSTKKEIKVGGEVYRKGAKKASFNMLSTKILNLFPDYGKAKLMESILRCSADGLDFVDFDSFHRVLGLKYGLINKRMKSGKSSKWERPSFSSLVYRMATASHFARSLTTPICQNQKTDYYNVRTLIDLQQSDLAVPHRFPWGAMQNILEEEDAVFPRPKSLSLNKSLDKMTQDKCQETVNIFKTKNLSDWESGYKNDQKIFQDELKISENLIEFSPGQFTCVQASIIKKAMNNAPGNVPDLGPHITVNIPVSDRMHLNAPKNGRSRRLSISSSHVLNMDYNVRNACRGVATTDDGTRVIGTNGERWDPKELEQLDKQIMNGQRASSTKLT